MHTLCVPVTGLISCFANLASNFSFLTENVQSPIISTTICSQHVDSAVELTLEKVHEVRELLCSDVLLPREIYAAVIRSVIDRIYHVPIPLSVLRSHQPLEIRANYSANNVDRRIVTCVLS